MNQKVSLWALFGVAAIALMLMANISNSDVTGEFTASGPRPPRATPAIRPPLARPVLVDRGPDTVVVDDYDDAAEIAMAERMARVERATCSLINLQLDREAGRNTPAESISARCPAWV